jgi:RES domain
MRLPPVVLLRQLDTHRLVPARYLASGESILDVLADDGEQLSALVELDSATNDRVLAGHRQLPGIGVEELVFGIPHATVVNAAFCHPHPLGARFSSPERGAWYAGFELATSQAEVAFHKTVQLAEIARFEETVTFDDYLADFGGSFHDLRARGVRAVLDPGSYVESQALAERLLEAGSLGIVYPSVRRRGGTCLACFRPALVSNVRRGRTYRFTWKGSPRPTISVEG